MSEPKAQLVDPQGNMNLPGMNATGVITASSFSGAGGVVTGLTGSPNLNVGVVTATSFVGDGTGHAANLTGTPNLNLGLTTATSFVGDAVGKAAGLTGTPNLNVGLITATSFAGAVTGDVTGNITGLAASITPGNNLNVGVATGIQWHGDGSNLTGAGSSAYIAQEITATGAETIIDLSDGNVIYYTQETASTTVGFASTSAAEQITFIRNPAVDDINWNISYSTGGVEFDGSDWLSIGADSDLNLDGDFTVEGWVYVDVDGWQGQRQAFFGNNISWQTNHAAILLMNSAAADEENTISLWQDTTKIATSQPVTITPADGWTHIAITRSGSSIRFFKNGTQAGSTATSSVTFTFGTGETRIANTYVGGSEEGLEGKISNLRVIKGTALYTDDFIPPTSALTNVTNTKLLCCQSDSSTTTAAVTPGTITAVGDPTAGAETIAASGTITISSHSITWPSTVTWNNGTSPTLLSLSSNDAHFSNAFQIFHLTTGDTGASYRAWEEMKNDSDILAGTLWAWGSTGNGHLGQNNQTQYSSPVQIPGTNWSGIGGVKSDGTAWVWGANESGELGLNNTQHRSSPTQLGTNTTWKAIYGGIGAAGQNARRFGIKTDGTLWSWGYNGSGKLGLNQGPGNNYSSPVQVGSDTTWPTALRTGAFGWSGSYDVMGVIKTDGTLWSWGDNGFGTSGQNNLTNRSSPVQIPGSTWKNVSGSVQGALLSTKTDGTLWAWGYNEYGQQGLNDRTQRSSPTQITGTTWKIVTGTGGKAFATKTDGTLWAWGYNAQGQLGQGNTTKYSSPVQIPGTTWDRPTTLGQNASGAIKTDGTIWTWGEGASGILGQNSQADVDSPVQVPGTTWIDLGGSQSQVRGQRSL